MKTALATVADTLGAAGMLRPRPQLGAHVYCGYCWEAITHDGDGWKHVRTGKPASWNDRQCAPQCDWPGCSHDADGGRSLGSEEWTGSAFRWRASHFLCDTHWTEYRRKVFTTEHIHGTER